jgi:flavin-dependent dehydrogenase
MDVEVDVAVVGAGPAGSIAALILARAGVRVAIIDASTEQTVRVGETVPPGFQREVAGLVAWEAAGRELAVPAYGNRSAWGSSELASQSFVFGPHGHGLHLDRARFDALLFAHAVHAGAIAVRETTILGVTALPGGRAALDSSGPRVLASAIVDASGRGACVARRLGAKRQLHDRMVAVLVRHDGCRDDDEGFTQVESVRDGWWYSAPQPQGCFVVAWMTDTDLLGPRAQLEDAWRRRLHDAPHTRARIGGGVAIAAPEIRSAAIQRCRSTRTFVPWIAVGDAALGVDPLSSSGIVRALRTGRAGATALLGALGGDRSALDGYEHGLDAELREHLELRARYYGIEQRFRGAPFWHRRHARGVAGTVEADARMR